MEELQLVRVDVLRLQPYNGVLLPPSRSCCSLTLCLLTINWMFCTNTACCADDLIVVISSHSGCITCSLDPRLFDTCLFALIALFGFSPAVGSALSSWVLGSHPWLFFLCPSRPSVPCSSARLARHKLRSGCCFVLPARAAYFFFFCADSRFRLARVTRARLFLLA